MTYQRLHALAPPLRPYSGVQGTPGWSKIGKRETIKQDRETGMTDQNGRDDAIRGNRVYGFKMRPFLRKRVLLDSIGVIVQTPPNKSPKRLV